MENKQASHRDSLTVHTPYAQLTEAMQSLHICVVAKMELDKVLLTAVLKAFHDKGQRIDPADMDYMVENLADALLFACPFVRIEEIPIAIQKGILGDFGDYYGLNIVTFVSFVKHYYSSVKRADIAKRLVKPEAPAEVPTEAEVLEKDKVLLAQAFETYSTTGAFQDHGNYLYKVAVKKLGLFSVSKAQQRMLLRQAKGVVLQQLQQDLQQRPLDRHKIKALTEQVTNLEPASEGVKRVYKEALQTALLNWFQSLVQSETTIQKLLQQ